MLPCVSWTELVPLDTSIALREAAHADGNVSPFELEVIAKLVKFHEPRALFEIGTFDGRTTINMAAHTPPRSHVYTLDLPPASVNKTALAIEQSERLFIEKDRSGGRFAGTEMAGKITQIYGDSGSFDFRPHYESMDFIFVDGSHSYEYVISDSEVALKLARPGAVILWHDYVAEGPTAWPGVTRAMHEMRHQKRFSGLRQIAGTSITHMQVPGSQQPFVPNMPAHFGDSSQPEHLVAELQLDEAPVTVDLGAPICVLIRARNIGRAAWLPEGVSAGPVRLGSRLLSGDGTWLDVSYSRTSLPRPLPVAPGESVVFNSTIPCPSTRGDFILDFDLVAEGIAWFSRNGSKTIKMPVRVT
jgi:predicted O-methyltransferase YrrM